jgi:hypothetical protein
MEWDIYQGCICNVFHGRVFCYHLIGNARQRRKQRRKFMRCVR